MPLECSSYFIPLWKTFWQFLLKLNIPNDPTVPLIGIYIREVKTYVHKKTYTRVFIVVLFVITTILEPPKCTTGECINKLWHIHTIESYSAVKKNSLLVHYQYTPQHGWISETLNWMKEAGQRRVQFCTIPHIWIRRTGKTHLWWWKAELYGFLLGEEDGDLLKGTRGNFSGLLHMFCILMGVVATMWKGVFADAPG